MMTGIFSQNCCIWFPSGWNLSASYIFWDSANGCQRVFPYSKKLLRCECHFVPSHCHDCKTELQTFISYCLFLLLNFLGVHRGFKMVECNCLFVLCCKISALEMFSFMPSLELFSCNSSLSVWKSHVFECFLSCEAWIWVVQDSLCEGFL